MKRKQKSQPPVRDASYVTSHPELDAAAELPGPSAPMDDLLPPGDQSRKPIISIDGRDVEDVPATTLPAIPQRAA